MNARWYFSHDGITYGPLSESEIADQVAQRRISANDPIWPEGQDAKKAAPAAAIFDFPKPAAENAAVPDWLADVALVPTKRPLLTREPTDEVPEWLEDLRLWVALDFDKSARATSSESTQCAASKAIPAEGIPDWAASWLTLETPKTWRRFSALPRRRRPRFRLPGRLLRRQSGSLVCRLRRRCLLPSSPLRRRWRKTSRPHRRRRFPRQENPVRERL